MPQEFRAIVSQVDDISTRLDDAESAHGPIENKRILKAARITLIAANEFPSAERLLKAKSIRVIVED